MNNNRLLDLREDSDLLQKDIANILGICRQTYSTWENNLSIIPLKHLLTLSNYYNVSIDYILKLSNTKSYEDTIKIKELNKQDIGNKIRTVRKENNITLRDIAKVLNTTSSTISAYETGKTLLLTAFAIQIAKEYNVSIDWICGLKSDKNRM